MHLAQQRDLGVERARQQLFLFCNVGGATGRPSPTSVLCHGRSSTLNVNASMANYNGAVFDGINISGSGTVVFNPPAGFPNLYCENTNIVSGTLKVGNSGAIPSGRLPAVPF